MGIFTSSILFWPGCYSSAKLEDKIQNYEKILKKLKIKYSLAGETSCCAGVLLNAGYDGQARKLIRENFEILKDLGIKKIITNCPLCFKTLTQDYPEILSDWDIDVEYILITILNKLRERPHIFNGANKEKIIYHDACYLGRYSEIYNQPREILDLLGYEVDELSYNKKEAMCCGTCGGLKQTNPQLADKVAKAFIKQILRTETRKIVTSDPQAYIHLKENAKDTGIEVIEFSEIIRGAIK